MAPWLDDIEVEPLGVCACDMLIDSDGIAAWVPVPELDSLCDSVGAPLPVTVPVRVSDCVGDRVGESDDPKLGVWDAVKNCEVVSEEDCDGDPETESVCEVVEPCVADCDEVMACDAVCVDVTSGDPVSVGEAVGTCEIVDLCVGLTEDVCDVVAPWLGVAVCEADSEGVCEGVRESVGTNDVD